MGLYAMDAIEKNQTIGRHAMEVLDRLRKERGDKFPGWEEITLAAWREEAENIIRVSRETEDREMGKLRRPLRVEEHRSIAGYIEFLRDLRRDARQWLREIDAEQRRLDEEAEEEKRLAGERLVFEEIFGDLAKKEKQGKRTRKK
ncbi:MAG: hypothetical protein GYA56_06440 [Geobacteraceae bacterium]|nr:hypothetical protein [Geobacteraceae bacterium]